RLGDRAASQSCGDHPGGLADRRGQARVPGGPPPARWLGPTQDGSGPLALPEPDDCRAPAALAVAAEPVALDRLVLGEQAVDRPPKHALALAVDDPQVMDAARATDLDVLAD